MKKAKKAKVVDASKLSTIAMTTGGEKKFTKVVDGGVLKEWVGIGWIDIGKASKEDKLKYPTVVR